MPFWKNDSSAGDALAQATAIGRSQAVIEFNMDGTIITANENFLDAWATARRDPGQASQHVRRRRPSATARRIASSGRALNRGEFQAAEYKRIGKGGREIWIQASYNPILDGGGKPFKVVKFATDITAQKLANMEDAGQIAAIGRAQAVIEFNMDGTIITANDNFLHDAGLHARRNPGQASQHVRATRPSATAPTIRSSGRSSTAASTRRPSTSGSARAARKSGSRLPTTRSSTRTASRSRW